MKKERIETQVYDQGLKDAYFELESDRFGETIVAVLRDAWQGTPSGLLNLLENRSQEYHRYHQTVKTKQIIPQYILESCFVEACEVYGNSAEYYPLSMGVVRKLNELNQKGVRPLDLSEKLSIIREGKFPIIK